MILLLTDVFLLLTQVLLWMVVGLVAWFVLLRALPRAFLSLLVLLLILAVLVISFVQGPPIDSGVLEILWRIISFPFTPLGLAIVLIAILLTNAKLNKFARRAMLTGLVILTLLSFPFVAYFLVQELELEAIEAICPAPALSSGARRVIALMGQGTTRSYLKPVSSKSTFVPHNAPPLNAADVDTLAQLPFLQPVEAEVDQTAGDRLTPVAFLPSSTVPTTAKPSVAATFEQTNAENAFLLAQTPSPTAPNRSDRMDQEAEQMKQRAEDAETRLKELNDQLQERQDQIDKMKERAEKLKQRAEEQRQRDEERQKAIEERRKALEERRKGTQPDEKAAPSEGNDNKGSSASPSPQASPKRRPRYAISSDAYGLLTAQPIQLTDKGNRLIYAANLFKQESSNNPLLVVSASTHLDRRQKEGEKREEISEAFDIQQFLTTTMNVPASGIQLDHNSRSVRRSAENVKKLLADQNINTGSQLTVVTTAMNMHRTALTFQQVFDDTDTEIVVRPTDFYTIPPPDSIGDLATGTDLVERQIQASDFLPDSYALYMSTRAIEEYISSFYYFLRGWMASPLSRTCASVEASSPPPPNPPGDGGTTTIVPNNPPPQDLNPSQPPTNGKW